MELIDIGINITHESFAADRDQVLARARAAGVVQLIATGSSIAASHAARCLARSHPGFIYATAGVHPHHASDLDAGSLTQLRELLADPAVVAGGECGLDYFRDYSPRAAQRDAFAAQLGLAAEARKPVFLHQRDAHADFIAILREHRPQLDAAVAHCFTGDAAQLEDYLQLDLAIGITGWICDERRGAHLKPLMPLIPADKLMLETDAPYLLPRTLRPRPAHRRNEPAYLPEIAATVARARGEDLQRIAAVTTAAARAFFRLPVMSNGSDK